MAVTITSDVVFGGTAFPTVHGPFNTILPQSYTVPTSGTANIGFVASANNGGDCVIVGTTISGANPTFTLPMQGGNMFINSYLGVAAFSYNSSLPNQDPYLLYAQSYYYSTNAGPQTFSFPVKNVPPSTPVIFYAQNGNYSLNPYQIIGLSGASDTQANFLTNSATAGQAYANIIACKQKNSGPISLTESPILYADQLVGVISTVPNGTISFPLPLSLTGTSPVFFAINSNAQAQPTLFVFGVEQNGNSVLISYSLGVAGSVAFDVIAIQNTGNPVSYGYAPNSFYVSTP
jgi:hypothetical protein